MMPQSRSLWTGSRECHPSPWVRFGFFPIPDSLTFAGERVPLEKQDIFERLEREIYSIAYWQSNTVLLMKRSAKYLPEISQILQEQGVPGDFKYLAMAESGLANVTSPAGAKGFLAVYARHRQRFWPGSQSECR